MKVTIKGMSSLNRKLGILPKLTNEAIYNATNEVTETVKGYAESNLQSSVKHASGELSGSIKSETEIEDQKKLLVGSGPIKNKGFLESLVLVQLVRNLQRTYHRELLLFIHKNHGSSQ